MYYKQRFPLMDIEYDSWNSSSGWISLLVRKEKSLQEIAQRQVCTHLEDAQWSELTSRLIKISSQKAGEILDAEKVKKEVGEIYSAIIQKKPITLKEQKYLLKFLSDEKAKSIAQNIFSQLYFLEWDKNTDFLKTYLKDDSGKLTLEKIIPALIEMITKYQFIIDINGTITEEKRWYFIYTLENDTQWVWFQSENKIFCLPETFQSIEILENGFIVGYTKNINANKTSEKIAKIYEFKNQEFEHIGNIPDGENIAAFDKNKLLFSQWREKYGLTRYSENETWEKEFKTLLPPQFHIIKQKGPFIIGFIKENGSFKGTLPIYKENQDWVKQLFSWEVINDTSFNEIFKGTQKSIRCIKSITNNYIEIESPNGTDIYFYDEENETLTLIEDLQWIHMIDWDVIEWNVSFILFRNGKRWQYIFDTETQKLRCLIEYKSKDFYNGPVPIDYMGRITIHNEVNQNWKIILWYNNKTLYQLKKWFSYGNNKKWLFVKNWFFGKKIYVKDYSYETLQEYLEKIEGTLVL